MHGLDGAPEWPTLLSMMPDMTGRSVVDLGCGFGWFSRWAADAGAAQVLGIDLSSNVLARAETDTAETTAADRIIYEQHDLDHLELRQAWSSSTAPSPLTSSR